MRFLPKGRDRKAEEDAFLNQCHRTKMRIPAVLTILEEESFFDAAHRQPRDVWEEFYASGWTSKVGGVKGSEIQSALRDHLAQSQGGQCCYCRQPLLKGGYARPIDHVLSRARHPRFSLHFWNLAVACERCNRIKKKLLSSDFKKQRKHYPGVDEFKKQFHPRFHEYDAHVQFVSVATNDVNITVYVGTTDQGKDLCNTVLKEGTEEQMLTSGDKQLADSVNAIHGFVGNQDSAALAKVAQFRDALVETIKKAAR
ncbi:HNH endonuclease [Paraburkholderia sp. BCC1876]|uniref:HNH endonuclease n=1 Tax=Paraburkholderia sp. BCC1876 TaxID=2676303 RepID=UPI00158FC6B1|nr:HNH endonuclease [Paraburkholderia sp. BCC1876]